MSRPSTLWKWARVFATAGGLWAMAAPVQAAVPAFPEAQGWGASALGPRGAADVEVRVVTTLDFSGPGSLQEAVSAADGRRGVFVVFRVAGYIDVPSETILQLQEPYVYIAGQTAPGGGVCLRLAPDATTGNQMVVVRASHVIIRYLCLRHGDDPSGDDQAGNINVRNGASDVIVDHVLSQWGSDEAADIDADPNDVARVTFQRMAFAEGLQPHATGLRMGGDGDALPGEVIARPHQISLHHSLFAHNNSRNPRVSSLEAPDGAGIEIINNVLYNTTESGGVDGQSRVDIVGNYFKEGPVPFDPAEGAPDPNASQWEQNGGFDGRPMLANQMHPQWIPSIHMAGNHAEYANGNTREDGAEFDLIRDDSVPGAPIPAMWRRASPLPAPEYPVDVSSAEAALDSIVVDGDVGNAHYVDEHGEFQIRPVDVSVSRVLTDVAEGRPQTDPGVYISNPDEVGGFPPIDPGTPYDDADLDGMADPWELSVGLDPADPTDFKGDRDGDGYLNIEEFINGRGTPSGGGDGDSGDGGSGDGGSGDGGATATSDDSGGGTSGPGGGGADGGGARGCGCSADRGLAGSWMLTTLFGIRRSRTRRRG